MGLEQHQAVIDTMYILRACPYDTLQNKVDPKKITQALESGVIKIDAAGYVSLADGRAADHKYMKTARARVQSIPINTVFTPSAIKKFLSQHSWSRANAILVSFTSQNKKTLKLVLDAMLARKEVQCLEIHEMKYWAIAGETRDAPRQAIDHALHYLSFHRGSTAQEMADCQTVIGITTLNKALLKALRAGLVTRAKANGLWYYSRAK